MANTNLGSRGYSIIKEEYSSNFLNEIRRDLTVKPFINSGYGNEAPPFPVYCESKRKLYMPRFYGIKKFNIPKTNKIDNAEQIDIDFPLNLKPKQEPIVEAYMNAIKSNGGGGIISVPCGYGKTVIALYIAHALKLKTLVVVHKEFLLNQWKERIEQFLPTAKVGRIQSNIIKTEGNDIVIGMLQSISMKEYPDETFKGFGLVIYDECHHLGAEVFSKALLKTNFKYTLGLSATPKRADGLSKVFEWYLGPIVFNIKKRDAEDVNVKIINYVCNEEVYCKEILNFKNKPNSPNMINNICEYMPRTNMIVNEIIICCKEGRKILVLSDRRDHLKQIKELLDTQDKYTSGFYLGGMKAKDLEKTEEKDVILGTFTMASEGFDCRYPLNTIFLTSPKSNIEQAVGRILRQEVSKRTHVPLIIDISDNFSLFSKQGLKREKFYKKNKYNITKYEFSNNTIKQIEEIKEKNTPLPDFDFLD